AGPIANFILAIIIFTLIYTLYGKQSALPLVDAVLPNSAAETAGFKPGDRVLTIDGRAISTFSDMQRLVSISAGTELEIIVERDGQHKTLKATPTLRETKDKFGNIHRIGILGINRNMGAGEFSFRTVDPLTAMRLSVEETWSIIDLSVSYIGRVIIGRE